MRRTTLAAGLSAAAMTLVSAAAQANDRIAPVTVTATRSAQTADESLSSVSVLTREEIERSTAGSMTELLGREPGIEISRNGGRGTNASIFLRGTESDHVLVLVDGVEVGSATSGTASFEDLPLANVERIEIVRGPRSSLYGSRAIGGVIQIFTRDSAGAHAEIGAGSNGRRQGSAGYGVQSGDTRFSVNVSAEETDGIDARANACAFCADEPDDDGYENRSVNINASQAIGERVELSARMLATDSEVEFDGSFQNRTESEQRVYSTAVDARLSDNWDARAQLSRSEDNNESFSDARAQNTFDTERDALSLQNEITLGTSQIASLGLDVERTSVDSNLAFAEDERDTAGVYAQHRWVGEAWSTELSLRAEEYDDFDDPVTGSAALGYRVTPAVQAFASYGTAFRAPTFNELYFPGFGNPDLEPEESRTVEAGLRGDHDVLRWQTTLYSTEIDELIDTVAGPGGTFVPQNVDEARITGVEVSVGAAAGAWDGDLSLDLKDTENEQTGAELPRRAQFDLRGSLTRDLGAWSLGADVQFQGDRFDDAANSVPLDAYGLLDLRAKWRFAADWSARLKVANVTDTDYQLADTYNTLGRTWMVEVAWRPAASD